VLLLGVDKSAYRRNNKKTSGHTETRVSRATLAPSGTLVREPFCWIERILKGRGLLIEGACLRYRRSMCAMV